jgi:hypothetical protein
MIRLESSPNPERRGHASAGFAEAAKKERRKPQAADAGGRAGGAVKLKPKPGPGGLGRL